MASHCTLHDAITAANTKALTNTCVAGTDSIQFSVTGTIVLSATLQTITDANLTITGPGGGITIDGGGAHLVMLVGSIIVNLQNLTIAHGFNGGDSGGLFNTGTLTITNCTFLQQQGRR